MDARQESYFNIQDDVDQLQIPPRPLSCRRKSLAIIVILLCATLIFFTAFYRITWHKTTEKIGSISNINSYNISDCTFYTIKQEQPDCHQFITGQDISSGLCQLDNPGPPHGYLVCLYTYTNSTKVTVLIQFTNSYTPPQTTRTATTTCLGTIQNVKDCRQQFISSQILEEVYYSLNIGKKNYDTDRELTWYYDSNFEPNNAFDIYIYFICSAFIVTAVVLITYGRNCC